ncbi:hypothetical protein K456DRAFT_39033 [Colletotrichum gloeosporioides 23]|nr:hypothetical protein K456DRAFT_39033 [Colletotrichum gloeosporioides 23]
MAALLAVSAAILSCPWETSDACSRRTESATVNRQQVTSMFHVRRIIKDGQTAASVGIRSNSNRPENEKKKRLRIEKGVICNATRGGDELRRPMRENDIAVVIPFAAHLAVPLPPRWRDLGRETRNIGIERRGSGQAQHQPRRRRARNFGSRRYATQDTFLWARPKSFDVRSSAPVAEPAPAPAPAPVSVPVEEG